MDDEPQLDCSLEGELSVELGGLGDGFVPLLEGEAPRLYYGAQGGTHLVLAARLRTPNPLARYQLTLHARVGLDAHDLASAGRIETLVDAPGQVEIVEHDEVELAPLLLVVDGWAESPYRRVSLEVEDACGRYVAVSREFGG